MKTGLHVVSFNLGAEAGRTVIGQGDSVNHETGAVVPVSIGQAHPAFSGTETALTAVKFDLGMLRRADASDSKPSTSPTVSTRSPDPTRSSPASNGANRAPATSTLQPE